MIAIKYVRSQSKNILIATSGCIICICLTMTVYMSSYTQFSRKTFHFGNLQLINKSDYYKDDLLIDYIKERFLDPPSQLPYNLRSYKEANNQHGHKYAFTNSKLPEVVHAIQKLYPQKDGLRNGYYVEAGALDGEFGSNSLYLELELGWTGLLVEPAEKSYKSLRQKHRKTWSCHCCLGEKVFPYETFLAIPVYKEDQKYFDKSPKELKRSQSSVISSSFHLEMQNNIVNSIQYEKINCLPICSIFKALDVQKVDFFSLDVEGTELGVLENFPWDEVAVEVWMIEHKSQKWLQSTNRTNFVEHSFVSWFERKGYELAASYTTTQDYVFIRRNSTLISNLKSEKK